VPAAPPPSRELPYKIGARVSHPRYGEGVVAGYQGQGSEMEIKVGFPKIGDKWFILEYVKLTAC
jgi:DNA helicase-2/ATP-dependent DNA helicase PcrA